MIPRTNNLRFWPRFPFRRTLSRLPLLAGCAIALSLVACANRKSANDVNLKSDSLSPKLMAAPADAEHSESTFRAIAASSGVQGTGTPAARIIKSCPLPPPGTKPVCNRT